MSIIVNGIKCNTIEELEVQILVLPEDQKILIRNDFNNVSNDGLVIPPLKIKIYDLSHKAAYGCFNPRVRLSTSCLCRHFSHPVGRPMGRNKPASARQATSSDPCMPARTPQCRRGDTRSRLAPTPCGTRPFFDFDVTPEQLVSIHAPAWGATNRGAQGHHHG